MTADHSALLTLLADVHDTTKKDKIRRITDTALQKRINAQAGAVIGAGR